jgi:hypothetical protein
MHCLCGANRKTPEGVVNGALISGRSLTAKETRAPTAGEKARHFVAEMQSLELSIEVVPIAFSEKLPDGWNPECVSRNALKTSQPRRDCL